MALTNQDLETLTAGSNYRFSATKLNKLGAAEYTLASMVIDTSGSVSAFLASLEQAVKTIFKAMDKSPRRDNLLLRLTQFNDFLRESHGFKLLNTIKESDYDNALQIGGMTALYDATDEAIQSTLTYGKQLTASNFLVNGIIVIVTDGQSNCGAIRDAAQIKKTLLAARRTENLESILLILVGVTQDDVTLNTYLQTAKDDGGFDQYVSIGNATPGRIAKLADFISQSISSTSTALANGTVSTPLPTGQFKF